jgi:hypothetical protein
MPDEAATGTPQLEYSTTFSRTAKLFAVVCIPVIVALVYYAPLLTSFGWHVIHGSAIGYHALRVEVPWGWTADLTALNDDVPGNPQGVTLQKPPRTLALEARGPELIYINVLLADAQSTPQQQAAEWQALFRESHPSTEFDLRTLDDAPGGASCIEATPRANNRGVAVACISLNEAWLANFAGSQTNLPLFLRVLACLKHAR